MVWPGIKKVRIILIMLLQVSAKFVLNIFPIVILCGILIGNK